MTNICGYERKAVACALRGRIYGPLSNEYDTDSPILQASGGHEILAAYHSMRDAFAAVDDPAKLAEMLAERGREVGLSIAIYDNHRRFRMSDARVVYALLIVADGFSIMDREKRGWDFDMQQARAILLQWFQLPDGAREEAEKVLRGEP